MEELETLKGEIEASRERLDRAVEEKHSIQAAYQESLELDSLIDRYLEVEKRQNDRRNTTS